MDIPFFSAWLRAFGANLKRTGHRVTYSIRDMYKQSLKVRKNQKIINLDIKDLKKAEHTRRLAQKIVDHLIREDVQADRKLKDMIDELKNMGTDLIVIFHGLKELLTTLAKEDNKIALKVPQAAGFRNRAVELLQKIDKLILEVGHAFKHESGVPDPFALSQESQALVQETFRRDSFPVRDIHRRVPALLKEEKHLKVEMKRFNKSLEKHVLKELTSSNTNIEVLIPDMIDELHHIVIDTVVLMHVSIKSINIILTNMDHLNKLQEINTQKAMFLQELLTLKNACKNLGAAMIGESRQERAQLIGAGA